MSFCQAKKAESYRYSKKNYNKKVLECKKRSFKPTSFCRAENAESNKV